MKSVGIFRKNVAKFTTIFEKVGKNVHILKSVVILGVIITPWIALAETLHSTHLLISCSTTSVTSWLWFNCFLLFIIRTMQASISCFLSSSTFRFVSFLSGSVSPCLALACWILTRWRFEVNCSLTYKIQRRYVLCIGMI